MSFTDQQPRIATPEDCSAAWGGKNNGADFRCYLCGHKFVPGDVWRWVWATYLHVINFLVCEECDGEDVKERWEARNAEFRSDKFWALR